MREMTSRERLHAAIRCRGPDRVPVSPRPRRYTLAHGGTQKARVDCLQDFALDPPGSTSARGPRDTIVEYNVCSDFDQGYDATACEFSRPTASALRARDSATRP
jgi:hypothetical protein